MISFHKDFTEEQMEEIVVFLSRIPSKHRESLKSILRSHSSDVIASASPWGSGEEIVLTDKFYSLSPQDKEFVILHENGHNYFDYLDEVEGDRSMLRFGRCRKEDVSGLLRVKWMELGWNLDPIKLKKLRDLNPENLAYKDKYTYTAMWKNPNHSVGEWICNDDAKIPSKINSLAFNYDKNNYSPKEEMADAYAFFILDRREFFRVSEKAPIVKQKYDFVRTHFRPPRV